MQVFTTIFLAEKLPASIDRVEEAEALDTSDLIEFPKSVRERILMFETRNWFEDDAANPEVRFDE